MFNALIMITLVPAVSHILVTNDWRTKNLKEKRKKARTQSASCWIDSKKIGPLISLQTVNVRQDNKYLVLILHKEENVAGRRQ